MPALPKLVADFVEPRFAHVCRIARIDDLAPKLRRVRFVGEALRGLSLAPGQEIEFRVSATAFRHYTPEAYDGCAGTLDVVFYLHGHGPGSEWATELTVGRAARVLGPGGRFTLASTRAHVLLGDETCLGLFAALARGAPPGARVSGAIEVSGGRERWPELVSVPLDAVVRVFRGEPLCKWLDRNRTAPDDDTTFYLAGHAGSIARLRHELRELGWGRSAIRTKPYWADGKRGL